MTNEDEHLSIRQAAKILNTSEEYIIKLIEINEIPAKVSDEGISISSINLERFKIKPKVQQRNTLSDLAKQAQELDMGTKIDKNH